MNNVWSNFTKTDLVMKVFSPQKKQFCDVSARLVMGKQTWCSIFDTARFVINSLLNYIYDEFGFYSDENCSSPKQKFPLVIFF